jgi:hypothetical protein
MNKPETGRFGAHTATLYRPTLRPRIAVLTVFDDGKTDGEIIRIRGNRFILGRSEGDFLIPHDGRISARHVEITRQFIGGLCRWVITDLQSTNGLFVRVSHTILSDRAEFLVGKGCYRFEAPSAAQPATIEPLSANVPRAGTRAWGDDAAPVQHPVLVEVVTGGSGTRMLLNRPECWIGSDSACTICRADDPFCEPWHVRLYQHGTGWHAENNKGLNGLWLRVPQITVENACLFQIGEQRFRLKVGG